MGQTFSKWLSPKRWEQAPFGMVLQKVGHQRKIKQRDYLTSGTLPVIDQGEVFIGGYTNDETARVAQKPPFVIFGDHTRQVKFVHFSFAPGADGVIILKPLPGIEVKLAYYFLQALVHFIPDKGYARHFQFLKKQEFPVPPLVEQRAIVAKIEELFSELDNGIDQLQTIKQQLKQYRQAVLKSAFEGKLTAEWRAEQQKAGILPDADELLEQIKKEREERYRQQLQEWKQAVAEWEAAGESNSGTIKPQKPAKLTAFQHPSEDELEDLGELPSEWVWVPLSTLGDLARGKSRHRPRNAPHLYGGPYPFIQTGDVKAANRVVHEYTQTYSEAGLAQSRMWQAGTLCITIAANIAESAFMGFDGCFPDSIVGFTATESLIDPNYVQFFLESAKSRIAAFAPATAQKNINLATLENLVVPYCATTEQMVLIAEVESRFSILDELDKAVDLGLQQAEALRQSTLKKAFEGRLLGEAEVAAVRNDPEYEPADKLLERIKADRAKDK